MSCASAVESFSLCRRTRQPLTRASFAPVGLTGLALVQALAAVSADVISHPSSSSPLQRTNSRSLVRKIKILLYLFESLADSLSSSSSPSPPPLSSSATLCLRELHILLHHARAVLDYCSQSGRLWLLLRNPQISGLFHDLAQDISTLLDVLPLDDCGLVLSPDVREQIELLRRQCRRSKLYVDPHDELLRLRIFSFLDDFERGRAPDPADLRAALVHRLGIRDARVCRAEIEFLEELIYGQEDDADPALLGGVVALARYCRFLLFGFQEAETAHADKPKSGIEEASLTIPKDFCCPISLDLMRDPVIVSTGQTYDRPSIVRWIDEGHSACPNSGQTLTDTRLVPNRALRSLISQWCAAHGIPYDPSPEAAVAATESMAIASASKAAVEANRATAEILVRQLSDGSEDAKTIAARELRLLAKTGKENRACIAEAGVIPLLCKLLCSSNPVAQENAVTAMLNLSIHDTNKSRMMEEEGCLRSVVDVLRQGRKMVARENAAATLFSLSSVHDYKKRIMDESSALEALVGLLREGSPRGQKDAVMALFNLCTHPESCEQMVESGAVAALLGALGAEVVAGDAAAALALLVRQPAVAEAVGREDAALASLVGLMRRGSPKGKEHAVAALHEMCRTGGVTLTQKVVRTPALGGSIQTILFSGTKRARRKAASLARMCQRSGDSAVPMAFGGGWSVGYALARNSSVRPSRDVPVSVPVAVSVL